MDEILIQRLETYAAQHQLRLGEQLGFGIHGIIFSTEGNPETGQNVTAVKVHRAREPYLRELGAYYRLAEASISMIFDFNVPRLIRYDNELCIIEMTIVARPFVLDFAGAFLDSPAVVFRRDLSPLDR